MFETGHFATLWKGIASDLGLEVAFVEGDWRHGADPAQLAAKLAADTHHEIKAVTVVHNETSTGVTSRIDEIRQAIDSSGHPALLMVDVISSLGSVSKTPSSVILSTSATNINAANTRYPLPPTATPYTIQLNPNHQPCSL